MDSYNLLVPHRCSGTNTFRQTVLEQYNNERTAIAFTDEERTRIINAENQPCDQFTIHPDIPLVERLFNEESLSFFANIGQLDAPVTKEDYYTVTRTELFAHNTLQHISQRIDPFDEVTGTGILGRMSDALLAQGFHAQTITISESTVATVGSPGRSDPPLVVSARGLNKFAPTRFREPFDIKEAIPLLNNATDGMSSIYGETWMDRFHTARTNAEELIEAMDRVELTQNYEQGGDYVRQVETIASLMMTHKERGVDRDLFWLSFGSWDHHQNLKPNLAASFQELNEALTLLEQELKAQGYYENVTVVLTSDFARTLTANSGTGSDHAWGGNLFTFGGAVRGHQILGDYPLDMTPGGPLNIGRGRLIPTLSWESMFQGVAEWMGVTDDDALDAVMPNRHQTGTRLFTRTDLFHDVDDDDQDDTASRRLRGGTQ